MLARFYREARAAATILHANVCPVYDVGETDGVPYLTMGYIEGKSLAEWVRAKPLTPRQSAALVRKLALALQEANKKGVIHRDLKPANIMIDKRGEPVIMDFGLARRNRPGDARLTQLGTVMGTPAYMPPEQVSGNPDAMGPACDIYSLGVWNQMEIKLRGRRLSVTVNGKATTSVQLDDDRVYRYLDGAPPAGGRIGLQHWLGSLRFRKLEIKELPAAKATTTNKEKP